MATSESAASIPLDWEAIRHNADAAVRDFVQNRWEVYLAMVERVEAWPENQDGADKTWVEWVTEICRRHYQTVRRPT